MTTKQGTTPEHSSTSMGTVVNPPKPPSHQTSPCTVERKYPWTLFSGDGHCPRKTRSGGPRDSVPLETPNSALGLSGARHSAGPVPTPHPGLKSSSAHLIVFFLDQLRLRFVWQLECIMFVRLFERRAPRPTPRRGGQAESEESPPAYVSCRVTTGKAPSWLGPGCGHALQAPCVVATPEAPGRMGAQSCGAPKDPPAVNQTESISSWSFSTIIRPVPQANTSKECGVLGAPSPVPAHQSPAGPSHLLVPSAPGLRSGIPRPWTNAMAASPLPLLLASPPSSRCGLPSTPI